MHKSKREERRQSTEAEVLKAHRARAAALVAGDRSALAALLAPGLHYIHAPGRIDNRESYLEFLASVTFLKVEVSDRQINVLGEVAILTGILRMTLQKEGQTEPAHPVSAITEVWHCRDNRAWMLINFQSTSIK
ncbi:MAG: nuclear transport factor 2 family protein [Oceanospirillales bacterium]|nr:nuclear transport factor 2 family protein [Oceanospirillales bacterium]